MITKAKNVQKCIWFQIVPLEPLMTYPKTSTLVRSKSSSRQTAKGENSIISGVGVVVVGIDVVLLF